MNEESAEHILPAMAAGPKEVNLMMGPLKGPCIAEGWWQVSEYQSIRLRCNQREHSADRSHVTQLPVRNAVSEVGSSVFVHWFSLPAKPPA